MKLLSNIDKRTVQKLTGTAIVLIAGVLAAQADSIYVPNASFESSPPAQTSTDTSIAPGWVFDIQGGSDFGVGSISSDFGSTGTSSGSNYAWINDDYPSNVADSISSAASLGTIASDTAYTLTIAIGDPTGTDSTDDTAAAYTALTANGNLFVLDPIYNTVIPDGTFQDFSFTFTPDPSLVGESLGIQMGSLLESGAAFQPSFDNVRLDATDLSAAPEPTTSMLLVSGLLGLGWLLRRRLNHQLL